uniref:Superoxide dismutase [Cu-Zn] n=1 Tax=Ixodes scapularis TaxID=6945 RepID=A0A4D5RUK4_IXOSC
MKIGAAQVIVALALAVLCCETLAETVKDGKKSPVLDCKGKNCKTKLAVSGCLECDCEKECPVLHCPPPCHHEENVPQDRCPECVCNGGGVPHPADDGQDVPCFTPMLRRTLRRLAELENQLRHVRHLVDDNELRLLRLFPALESRGGFLIRGSEGMHGASSRPGHHHHGSRGGQDDENPNLLHVPHQHGHKHSGEGGLRFPLNRPENNLIHRDDALVQGKPRLSETEYDFAICRVRPNTALPVDQQQPVNGLISLWQQKESKDLNVHVHVTGFKANASARDHRAYMHGMHVHVEGNLTESCQSTGAHFNPTATVHGDRRASIRHVGDFGNIACDKHGITNVVFTDTVASLTGPSSIVGRSINIHAHMDDLGKNPHIPASVSSGNAGPRIACCIIEKVDKLPQLSTKTARRILRDIMQPFSDIENE